MINSVKTAVCPFTIREFIVLRSGLFYAVSEIKREKPVQLDWNIKVGDILTSITIIVSVAALIVTWTKDRNTKETEQANVVRTAAATAMTQLDRWQSLNLSLYQEMQPEFITTSEMLGEQYDVIKVRDYLWRTISNQIIEIDRKVLNEKISTSYVDLIAHFPDTRAQFIDLFRTLNEIEERISGSFLEKSQQDVFEFEGKENDYTSAMLGNALRTTAEQHKDKLFTETTKAIDPVKEFLFGVIAKSNKQILHASHASKNR